MAIVVPYGDAQAHGSLACSVSFRRSRGKVVFQKKPKPRQPNTAAQQAHKQKFRDGWTAYHQLDAWAVDYLQKKAAELSTTKANLYLSQYLKDEIPSTNPLSLIKDILDISIPEPESDQDDGMIITALSYVDAGPVETSFGHIYDKENVFVDGAVAGAHQRELIRLGTGYATPLDIPFDYPLIVTWKAFNDVEYISLIRFPEITVQGGAPTSDTPMTNVKEITHLNLITPLAGSPKIINFQFLAYKTSTQQYQGMGNIWDNENIFRAGVQADPYDKIFLQVDDIEGTPSTIPADYEIEISYKDFTDKLHHLHLKLPTFQLAAGTVPSTTPLDDVKKITDMVIGRVIAIPPNYLLNYFVSFPVGEPEGWDMARVHDFTNVFSYYADSPSQEDTAIQCRMRDLNADLIENYYIDISYDDWADDPQNIRIWLPFKADPGSTFFYLYIADDGSVYYDKALTQLAKPADPNRKRLWIADDWSLYWDDAFTSLAKAYTWPPTDLWLADDFSLYYDKALTQLANMPFF